MDRKQIDIQIQQWFQHLTLQSTSSPQNLPNTYKQKGWSWALKEKKNLWSFPDINKLNLFTENKSSERQTSLLSYSHISSSINQFLYKQIHHCILQTTFIMIWLLATLQSLSALIHYLQESMKYDHKLKSYSSSKNYFSILN